MKPIKLALFASGTGSNAESIIRYFEHKSTVEVVFVLSNKVHAPIVEKATSLGVHVVVCSNQEVEDTSYLVQLCQAHQIDYIILAGFLRKIPDTLIQTYPEKIINIHPSLLPKYGGAGMYGLKVHQAVKEAGETESGITIHYVSEHFDEGQRIAQFYTTISETDSPDEIQQKIHQLERTYFPIVVEKEINRFIQ